MKTGDTNWPDDVADALEMLAPGNAFEVPEVLFSKITDDQREDWQARFSGTRD
jgi:methionyl-tRNA synthetase